MITPVARPDITTLVLRTYARMLHPELFDWERQVEVKTGAMRVLVRLGTAGHSTVWRSGGDVLTEMISDGALPVLNRERVLEHRLCGSWTESHELESGLRYSVACSFEQLSPTVFLRQQEEFVVDSHKASLSVGYAGHSRLSPGAMSLIRTDTLRDDILVQTIHTFPSHLAIIKTQSLFEVAAESKPTW